MGKIQIIVLALVLALIFVIGEAEAKKKRSPLEKRPTEMEPELYCNACQAIVREVLKKIGESKREYDIADALSNICIQKHFSEYEYPPPDVVRGCHAFLSGWDEVLENMFMKRVNNESIESDICVKKTKACLGVDPKNRKQTDNNQGFVKIGNKHHPIGEDGSVKIDGSDL